jgi:flagellar FliL protein
MTDATPPAPDPQPARARRSRKPLLIGLALALLAGGGGFAAVATGLLFAPQASAPVAPLPAIAFVPIEPLIISLDPAGRSRHLRFSAQIETPSDRAAEVAALMPRIVDVLNGYLRAVGVAEIEDPAALVRLRAQMLRRIQIVTGEGRVRDLLITEFVLN